MGEKIITDYTISVGRACRSAHYLKAHGLRKCSNPLDWMMAYTLENVIRLFDTGFSNFFENKKEHVEKTVGKFRYVEDLQNGMISMHSFPLDKDIESVYENFHLTMKRRFERMKKHMLKAEHVLFVSNRDEPVENFESFLTEMHKKFPCKFAYLNIRHSGENKREEIVISSKLKIIDYGFFDVHPDGDTSANPDFWKGNAQEWDKVMKNIVLRKKFAGLNLANFEDKKQK